MLLMNNFPNFTGFFSLLHRSMPTYLQWMPFISWMMFASEAISIAQWDGVKSIGKHRQPLEEEFND